MIRVMVVGGGNDAQAELCAFLSSEGMDVLGRSYADDPVTLMSQATVDVAIVDAEPSAEQGFLVATRLRLDTSMGVILLLGASQDGDRLLALSLGVDQYCVKPLDLHELALRIRSLHQRLSRQGPETALLPLLPPQTVSGAWRFDLRGWKLTAPSGQHVLLSPSEYHFLARLLEYAGEVVAREDLISALQRGKLQLDSRNLDMIVSRLRRKVHRASGEHLPVRSARGMGYVFTGHAVVDGLGVEIPPSES